MLIGYIDDAEAYDFLELRFTIDYSLETLQKALYRAFDKIESIDVRNSGATNNFPRTTELEVPKNIKEAQMLEAHSIALTPLSGVNVDNIKSKSTGKMSVTYSDYKIAGVEFQNKVAFDILNRYRRKTY